MRMEMDVDSEGPTNIALNVQRLHKLVKLVQDNIVKTEHSRKTHGQQQINSLVSSHRTETLLCLLELKELHREINLALEDARHHTELQTEAMDQVNLQLQSLIYEKAHLENEIATCKNYSSQIQDIELVPEKEFESQAPHELIVDSVANPHQYLLNRLTLELRQRKHLLKEVDELKLKKKSFQSCNRKKEAFLKEIPSHLRSIINSVSVVQSQFALSTEDIPLNPSAKYLPAPLYTLFFTAVTHNSAFDMKLSVSIEGSISDLNPCSMDVDTESKSKDEPSVCPLFVRIKFNTLDLILHFRYLSDLHVITVCVPDPMIGPLPPQSRTSSSSAVAGVDLTDKGATARLLSLLYPKDDGLTVPNSPSQSSLPFDPQVYGFPYRWAQFLGGLHYPYPPNAVSSSFPDFRDFFQKILERTETQTIFAKDLTEHLQRTALPNIKSISFRPKTSFHKWWNATAEQFFGGKEQAMQHSSESSSAGYQYFGAIMYRNPLQLQALIQINPAYPLVTPQFRLQLLSNTSSKGPKQQHSMLDHHLVLRTADPDTLAFANQARKNSDAMLQEMEDELNRGVDPALLSNRRFNSCLLYLMKKLQFCIDVYVDAESGHSQPGQGKLFNRGSRGRDRRKPYWYDVDQKCFDQRV